MNKNKALAFVADSCADFRPEDILAENLRVIPLNIHFPDGRVLRDGVDMTMVEFFNTVDKLKELPTTSQPSPALFREAYEELLAKYEKVLSFHVSGGISGTYQSAVIGRELLETPALRERVYVYDTRQASLGQALPYYAAQEALEQGASAQEAIEAFKAVCDRATALFTVGSLENLRKGGRISHISSFLGELMSIKPVMQLGASSGGVIAVEKKIRGYAKAMREVIQIAKSRADSPENRTVGVMHSVHEDPELLASFIAMVKEELKPKEIVVSEIGATIGTHIGRNGIAVAYVEKAK